MSTNKITFVERSIERVTGTHLISLHFYRNDLVKLPRKYIKEDDYFPEVGDTVTIGLVDEGRGLVVSLKVNETEYFNFSPKDYDEARKIENSTEFVVSKVEEKGDRYCIDSRVSYSTTGFSLHKHLLRGHKVTKGDVIILTEGDGFITGVGINGKEIYHLGIEKLVVSSEREVEENEQNYTFFANGHLTLPKRFLGNKKPAPGDKILVFYTAGGRVYQDVAFIIVNGEVSYEGSQGLLEKLSDIELDIEGKELANCIKTFIDEGLTDEERNILKQIVAILHKAQDNFEYIKLIHKGKKEVCVPEKLGKKELFFHYHDTGLDCYGIQGRPVPYFILVKGNMRLVFEAGPLSPEKFAAQLIVGSKNVFTELLNSL